MKKLNLFALMVVILLFNSCGVGSKEPTPSHVAKEQATIILNCFKTGETEKLKSLFCEEVRNSHDLDKEIATATDFIEGKIIYDGKWIGMSEGGKSVDSGVTTKLDIHPSIIDIETDTQQKYSISFDTYLVYTANKQNLGIAYITIIDKYDKEIIIGEIIY